ncbi:peptidoglycan-binding protein [Nocardiopsis sp. NPDC101807]|uniref:peptidoglycan-binding domain-containing protein n=1 Tax=Nocardiopsis sp. NPDC101807 TaxID=3364339 RepID=UPI0037FF9E92
MGLTGRQPELKVDGDFGLRTLEGVEWFQGQVGVTVDGLWGKDTEAAPKPPGKKKFPLASGHYWYGPESSNARNHSGYWERGRSAIRDIQSEVGVKKNGRYRPRAKAAVADFQRRARFTGRNVDGLTGLKTWRRVFG